MPSPVLFGGVRLPNRPSLENIRVLDLLPLSFIRRSHRLGMAIDRDHFHDLGSKFQSEKGELEKDISSYIPPERLREFSDYAVGEDEDEDEEDDKGESGGRGGDSGTFNAGSPEQVSKLLFDMLGIGTRTGTGEDRKLKRTDKGQISTGKKQLETLRLSHPVVPLVLRHREINTLINRYCKPLPKLARFHPKGDDCPVCELSHASESWRVHGEMGTTRAETGRINHKNPNLGNVPVRTQDGRDVQAGFIAPKGCRLVTCDLSQIELRDLAHVSNAESMIRIYANRGDIHDNTARKLFNLDESIKPDKYNHRLPSKRCNFSLMNGTTEKGLYLQLVMDYGMNGIAVPDWLTEDWCKQFGEKWLDTYPEVREYFDVQHFRARRYGLVWEPFGRVRLVPEVKSCHAYIRQAGLRQAQNFPVTSLAAAQLKLCMGKSDEMFQRVYESGVWCWPLLSIHDCIKCEVDEDAAEDVLEGLGECMDTCMNDVETKECMLRVPVESDGHVSERWT